MNEHEYIREIATLQAQLAALSWARWIPVAERLPESIDDIWIWDYDEPIKGYYLTDLQRFISYDGGENITHRVTHWMQLPPAPAPEP